MAYGGMVHALKGVQRLLKSNGVLVDMHPVAEASPIEIVQGGRIEVAGDLMVRQWFTDYQQADMALAEAIQLGFFFVEREGLFDSMTYYDSVEEMRTSLKRSFGKFARDAQAVDEDLPQAEALAARADELMRKAGSGAEVRAHERIHISRMKPV